MSDEKINLKSSYSTNKSAESLFNPSSAPEISEIQRLVQENLQRTQELIIAVKDIKANIKLQQLWGLLRLLIIIVPVVLGFIYLPSLIRELIDSYQSLFK